MPSIRSASSFASRMIPSRVTDEDSVAGRFKDLPVLFLRLLEVRLILLHLRNIVDRDEHPRQGLLKSRRYGDMHKHPNFISVKGHVDRFTAEGCLGVCKGYQLLTEDVIGFLIEDLA